MKIINQTERKNKYLSFNERYFIYLMHYQQGLSNRNIGRILKRSHTTVWDEFKRFFYAYPNDQVYCPEKAHKLFMDNQRNKWNKLKIESNEKLRKFIIDYLEEEWSPQQISWRLNKLRLEDDVWYACTETIYKFIYDSDEWKMLKLHTKLMRHRHVRKKYSSRAINWSRTKIKDRTAIKYRASRINNRKELWHWESDTMEFNRKRTTKHVLSVQVERISRLVKITRLKDKTAGETYWALSDLTNEYHQHWIVKSITFDNWSEWALHYKLKEEFEDIDTYFCDSYKSWQKWAVENMNMFIRRYLPRDIDIENVTNDQILEIQEKLNNRPRKCIWYLTPREYLQNALWKPI